MQRMINSVYNTLKAGTAGLQKKLNEYEILTKQEKSGIFSKEYLEKEIRPRIKELRHSIEKDKAATISSARDIVKAYQDELREKDILRAEDITEDARLFTAGIKLNKQDLEAILARNTDNPTMTQIALRYAQENKIDLGGKVYVGHQAEIQRADGIASIVDYYNRWIDDPDAGNMLNKFFGVSGE